MPNQPQSIRLNKFLAERLGVSRRKADELIASGQIKVDNTPATLGNKIDSKSKILYNNKLIPFEVEYKYLAFHKPVGFVCSRHAQGKAPTIYELLPKKYHELKTVGRLDKDSSGLILLTNDGDFANNLMHPKHEVQKTYLVTVLEYTADKLEKLKLQKKQWIFFKGLVQASNFNLSYWLNLHLLYRYIQVCHCQNSILTMMHKD
jgi:23S rRNA pseudouridine2605 synthase